MTLWEEFIRDRKILRGCSPDTIRFYGCVRTAWLPILPIPTKASMLTRLEELLASKVSPISVNSYLRGLRVYVRWLHAEGHIPTAFCLRRRS